MDGTFHAIATMLHRVPRAPDEPRGKGRPAAPRPDDRDPALRDNRNGWIRVAL